MWALVSFRILVSRDITKHLWVSLMPKVLCTGQRWTPSLRFHTEPFRDPGEDPLVFVSISIAVIDHLEQMQPGKERTYFSLQFHSMVLYWVKLGQELGGKNWWGHHGGTLLTSLLLWLVQPIVHRTIYLPRGDPTITPPPSCCWPWSLSQQQGRKLRWWPQYTITMGSRTRWGPSMLHHGQRVGPRDLVPPSEGAATGWLGGKGTVSSEVLKGGPEGKESWWLREVNIIATHCICMKL